MDDTFWWTVATWTLLLGPFLLFVPFYRRRDRKPAIAFLAFLMLFGLLRALPERFGAFFLGTGAHNVFLISVLVGGAMILGGWAKISQDYYCPEDDTGRLVESGFYRRIRHPQYAGFIVVSFGILVKGASALLMLVWPVVALLYYRLARHEDKILAEKFGYRYQRYAAKTGLFLPRFRGTRKAKP